MEVVYGATKEGAFLSNHDLVRSIHLTGSTATYDAVVWGSQKKVSIGMLRIPYHDFLVLEALLTARGLERRPKEMPLRF